MSTETLPILEEILSANDLIALENRRLLDEQHVLAVNVMVTVVTSQEHGQYQVSINHYRISCVSQGRNPQELTQKVPSNTCIYPTCFS